MRVAIDIGNTLIKNVGVSFDWVEPGCLGLVQRLVYQLGLGPERGAARRRDNVMLLSYCGKKTWERSVAWLEERKLGVNWKVQVWGNDSGKLKADVVIAEEVTHFVDDKWMNVERVSVESGGKVVCFWYGQPRHINHQPLPHNIIPVAGWGEILAHLGMA